MENTKDKAIAQAISKIEEIIQDLMENDGATKKEALKALDYIKYVVKNS